MKLQSTTDTAKSKQLLISILAFTYSQLTTTKNSCNLPKCIQTPLNKFLQVNRPCFKKKNIGKNTINIVSGGPTQYWHMILGAWRGFAKRVDRKVKVQIIKANILSSWKSIQSYMLTCPGLYGENLLYSLSLDRGNLNSVSIVLLCRKPYAKSGTIHFFFNLFF